MKYLFILLLFYIGWRLLRGLLVYLLPPPTKSNPTSFPPIDIGDIEDAQFREINDAPKS